MKFTPAAANFTSTSFALGCGTGNSTSSIASGPPCWFTCIAFMEVWTLRYEEAVGSELGAASQAPSRWIIPPREFGVSRVCYTGTAFWSRSFHMAENAPQSYAHHTRWDPWFHFFLGPVFLIGLIM